MVQMIKHWVRFTIKWILILVIGTMLGFPIAAYIGQYLPDKYSVQKSRSFDQPPQMLWDVLSDVSNYTKWKPNVRRVEILGRNDSGYLKWREYYSPQGSATFQITDQVVGSYMQVSLVQTTRSILGTWVYQVKTHRDKGILQVKQFAVVKQPFRRFEYQYILGHRNHTDKFILSYNRRIKRYEKQWREINQLAVEEGN